MKKKDKQEFSYITPHQSSIWEKLAEYKNVVEGRLNSAEFALFIANAEGADWASLSLDAGHNVTANTGKNGQYLHDIAQRHLVESKRKVANLEEAIKNLKDVLLRVNNALATLEVNSYVSELDSMPIYGSDVDFDVAKEDKNIKSLLYATDALLEITQK